jgi:hypothetical protein
MRAIFSNPVPIRPSLFGVGTVPRSAINTSVPFFCSFPRFDETVLTGVSISDSHGHMFALVFSAFT